MSGISTTAAVLLLVMCCDTISASGTACLDTMTLYGTFCADIDSNAVNKAKSNNFAGGESNCAAVYHADAHFPHIRTEQDNTYFRVIRAQSSATNQLIGEKGEIWLNLKCNQDVGKWQWQDDGSDLTWSNWGGDASCTKQKTELCAVIKNNGKWGKRACQTSALTICQLEMFGHHCAAGCNTGTCVQVNSQFKCICPMNTYGDSCSQTCGGPITRSSAPFEFSSTTYPRDTTCIWVYAFAGMPKSLVPTVTLDGKLEAHCKHDSVNMYEGVTSPDGTVTQGKLLYGPLCGDVSKTYTGQPKKDMVIVFKSNGAEDGSLSITNLGVGLASKS